MDEIPSAKLQELAKQGNLEAIASLVQKAIAPRNVKVTAEMSESVTLWLKIYPLATMQPKLCIQKVIEVVNDIHPHKILVVRVSEIAPGQTFQVWDRFLGIKNGEFVDQSDSLKMTCGVMATLILGLVLSLGYCAFPKQVHLQTTTPKPRQAEYRNPENSSGLEQPSTADLSDQPLSKEEAMYLICQSIKEDKLHSYYSDCSRLGLLD
jgi:hypothetical protein